MPPHRPDHHRLQCDKDGRSECKKPRASTSLTTPSGSSNCLLLIWIRITARIPPPVFRITPGSRRSVFNRSTRFGFLMDVTCSRRHRGCFRVAETGLFSASTKSRQALRARYSKDANVARHAAGTRVCACKEMMFDCSCVCHWGFQNEVIGG